MSTQDEPRSRIAAMFSDHETAMVSVFSQIATIQKMAALVWSAVSTTGTVYLCGNGGSAADAQHLAAELMGRFKKERRPLRAVALTTDTSVLTAVGNDYGFDLVFDRQVDALVREGDVLVCLSTSGDSTNVILAAQRARQRRAVVLTFTGSSGGRLAQFSDYLLTVNSKDTARIQECHIFAGHAICELVERML